MPAATAVCTSGRSLIDLNGNDVLNYFPTQTTSQFSDLSPSSSHRLRGGGFDPPQSFDVRNFLPSATSNRKQPFDQRSLQPSAGRPWHSFRSKDSADGTSRPLSQHDTHSTKWARENPHFLPGQIPLHSSQPYDEASELWSPMVSAERNIGKGLDNLKREVSRGITESDMRSTLDQFHDLLDRVEDESFSFPNRAGWIDEIEKAAFTLLRQGRSFSNDIHDPISETCSVSSPFHVEPAKAVGLAMRLFQNTLTPTEHIPIEGNNCFVGEPLNAQGNILPEFYQHLMVSFQLSSHELEALEHLLDNWRVMPAPQDPKKDVESTIIAGESLDRHSTGSLFAAEEKPGDQSNHESKDGTEPLEAYATTANRGQSVGATNFRTARVYGPIESEEGQMLEDLGSAVVKDVNPLEVNGQPKDLTNTMSSKIAMAIESTCAPAEETKPSIVSLSSHQQPNPSPKHCGNMNQRTLAALEAASSTLDRPYINHRTVKAIQSGLTYAHWGRAYSAAWHGKIIHVDFSDEEMEDLVKSIMVVRESPSRIVQGKSLEESIICLLKGATSVQLSNTVNHLHGKKKLEMRSRQSILEFMKDASKGIVSKKATVLRVKRTDLDPNVATRSCHKVQALLRSRELGLSNAHGFNLSTRSQHAELTRSLSRQLKQWKTFTGASSDVIFATWAPNGNFFAIGAASHSDVDNMQYNRKNNLLLGYVRDNILKELPDHCVDRPRPELLGSGYNANAATFNACDSKLYMTVTAAKFCESESLLFSASYDKTVKIWDTSSGQCQGTLLHDGEVTLLATNKYDPSLLSTGANVLGNSIRTYKFDYDQRSVSVRESFGSRRTPLGNNRELHPSCLQWGTSNSVKNLLVAGYAASPKPGEPDSPDPLPEGDLICYDAGADRWVDISPSKQNVFDCSWHPDSPYLAVATVPRGGATERWVRSVVRVFDPIRMKRPTIEYECPALDINDITFCPSNSNYIAAGCTDGVTYVWDYRMGHRVLHSLKHGEPIATLNPDLSREQFDTGVRLALWGEGGQDFFTGSSDGIIKSWDIRRSSENIWVSDVVQLPAGIMCGAFSPDYQHLLLGDSSSAMHILTFTDMEEDADVEEMHLESSSAYFDTSEDTALQAGRELIGSGELVMHPVFGAGKGPNYRGPYARYARSPNVVPTASTPLLAYDQARQLCPLQRSLAGPAIALSANEREVLEVQTEMAYARNARRPRHQPPPKRAAPASQFDDGDEDELAFKPGDRRRKQFQRNNISESGTPIVDLTQDEPLSSGRADVALNGRASASANPEGPSTTITSGDANVKEEENDSDWMEDDHWQPYWEC